MPLIGQCISWQYTRERQKKSAQAVHCHQAVRANQAVYGYRGSTKVPDCQRGCQHPRHRVRCAGAAPVAKHDPNTFQITTDPSCEPAQCQSCDTNDDQGHISAH